MSTQRIKFLILIMLLVFLNINCSMNPFRRPEADVDVYSSVDLTIEWTGSYDAVAGECLWTGLTPDGTLTLLEKKEKAGATFYTYSVHYTTSEGVDFNTAWPGYPEFDFTSDIQNGRVEKGEKATANIHVISTEIFAWSSDALNLSTSGLACCWNIPATQKVLAKANVTIYGRDDGGHNITKSFIMNIWATVVAI